MQLNNKFLFDRDFDVEKVNQQRLLDDPAPDAPIAPMFDEETLVLAQTQAYQQGVADGRQEAEQSQQQMLLGLWDRAGQKLAALLDQDAARAQAAQALAIKSAFHVLKKFWPRLQAPSMQQDLENFISEQLAANSDETRLVLRVNDAQLDQIAAQIPRLKELQGFAGKVITLADDSVMAGDCKMEWADGGVEKLGRQMMSQLDQLMERLLSQLAHTKHQSASAQDLHKDADDTHDLEGDLS